MIQIQGLTIIRCSEKILALTQHEKAPKIDNLRGKIHKWLEK